MVAVLTNQSSDRILGALTTEPQAIGELIPKVLERYCLDGLSTGEVRDPPVPTTARNRILPIGFAAPPSPLSAGLIP